MCMRVNKNFLFLDFLASFVTCTIIDCRMHEEIIQVKDPIMKMTKQASCIAATHKKIIYITGDIIIIALKHSCIGFRLQFTDVFMSNIYLHFSTTYQ